MISHGWSWSCKSGISSFANIVKTSEKESCGTVDLKAPRRDRLNVEQVWSKVE